jgi:hypothetical protein
VSFWKIVGAVFVGLWLFTATAFFLIAFLWMTFVGVLVQLAEGG